MILNIICLVSVVGKWKTKSMGNGMTWLTDELETSLLFPTKQFNITLAYLLDIVSSEIHKVDKKQKTKKIHLLQVANLECWETIETTVRIVLQSESLKFWEFKEFSVNLCCHLEIICAFTATAVIQVQSDLSKTWVKEGPRGMDSFVLTILML